MLYVARFKAAAAAAVLIGCGVVVEQVAQGQPQPIAPECELGPMPLGHVFLTTEEIEIPIVTDGSTLQWKIIDFYQQVVAEKTEPVAGNRVTIVPPKRNGYFLLHAQAIKRGRPIGQKYVPFAVIPPHEVGDRDKSPFGVMTHFAQGYDVDIFPLIAKAGIVSIRDEHYWGRVEKEPGMYEFDERSNRYMAEAAKHKIDPLVAMTFGNRLYDQKDSDGNWVEGAPHDFVAPWTPDACRAYANYGKAILHQYGDQIKWLEIWNEYNGSFCVSRR